MNKIFDQGKPYYNLPLLPPNAELESKEILKQLVKSHQTLAELKGYSELLPDKTIIINSIILQEAKDSSEIENIVTTHDEIYKATVLNGKNITPEVQEVLNYRSAIFKGLI